MMGSILALLTGVCFALNDVFIRRAALRVSDASLGTLISVPMAVPIFLVVLAATGRIQDVLSFSRQSVMWLSLAGIFFFVIGRSLSYRCIQLVGANITSILRRANILVAVVLGIFVLAEPLSWTFAIGVLLIVIGISLVGLNPRREGTFGERPAKIPLKALMLGLGAGVAWGLAPIFAKIGLEGASSPLAGLLISFLAATAVLGLSMASPGRRQLISRITGKAVGLFFIAGLFSCTGNFCRYAALNLIPASVVTPIVATSPVFLLIFSYIFNRNLEIFSRPVIIGTVIVVVGTILLL